MTTATYAPAASAVTAAPQLAPYGIFGDIARTVAPIAGQTLGSVLGNQQLGAQIGNTVGHFAGFLPFSAGPGMPIGAQAPVAQQAQLAPYGIFGDIARTVAPIAGQTLGGLLGNQHLGGQIGNTVGQIAGFLPFSAPAMPYGAQAPVAQQQAQLAPYGIFGDIARTVAPIAGQAVGGLLGNQQLGGQIGHAVGQLSGFLPFSAPAMPYGAQAPVAQQQAQLAPYGIFGDITRTVAPIAGQAIGGALGNQQLGGQIGNTVGQIAGFLPFSAGPAVPQAVPQAVPHSVPQVWQTQQPQLAPYGTFGEALGNVLTGGALGGVLGLGHRQFANTIGATAGPILGSILPFSVGPTVPPLAYHTPFAQYTC